MVDLVLVVKFRTSHKQHRNIFLSFHGLFFSFDVMVFISIIHGDILENRGLLYTIFFFVFVFC